MGRPAGNKSSAPKGGSSIWSGVLIGMIVGVGMAAGVAWYLLKSPKPFPNKETSAKPSVEPAKPAVASSAVSAVPATAARPAAGDGKQRFEFYKVLTDKERPPVTAQPAEKPHANKAHENAGQPAFVPQILQIGSFSNVDDAEKLKAKLALLGMEANIQTAAIPDKGVWYRVRLGPYKSAEAIGRARSFLKQNGVDGTPMKVQ